MGEYNVGKSWGKEDHGEIIHILNNLSLEEADNWRPGDHKNHSSQSICRNFEESTGFPTAEAQGLYQFYAHFKMQGHLSWFLDYWKKIF